MKKKIIAVFLAVILSLGVLLSAYQFVSKRPNIHFYIVENYPGVVGFAKRALKITDLYFVDAFFKGDKVTSLYLEIPWKKIINLNLALPKKKKEDGVLIALDNKYNIEFKYRGDSENHWIYPKKSIRLSILDNQKFNDMTSFHLILPEDRGYISEDYSHYIAKKLGVEAVVVLDLDQIQPMLVAEKINCPSCGKCNWTEAKQFNLMFKTQQGTTDESSKDIYLRPETAQGIFTNFKNVLDTERPRLPFGIAQIGKAFRNEITPGNFTFRTREFEQMEIEYFVDPKDASKQFEQLKAAQWDWFKGLGLSEESMRYREHEKDELSFYSDRTIDIEYEFPWGWGELSGIANRTDYDLSQHEKFSGQELKYTDPDDPKNKFIPYVIEPTFGCDRTVLTFLLEAYTEEELENGDVRTVMKFDPRLAPYDLAILPLSKKEHLIAKAQEIYKELLDKTDLVIDFDVTGSIGKRYRRQDEIGTPKAITVDFGTLGEDKEQGEKDT